MRCRDAMLKPTLLSSGCITPILCLSGIWSIWMDPITLPTPPVTQDPYNPAEQIPYQNPLRRHEKFYCQDSTLADPVILQVNMVIWLVFRKL